MGPGLRRDGEEAGVEIATHHTRRRQLDYSLLRRDDKNRVNVCSLLPSRS